MTTPEHTGHVHAPCVNGAEGALAAHEAVNKGWMPQSSLDTFHQPKGCGDCPRAASLGRCAALNAVNIPEPYRTTVKEAITG